MGVFSRKKAGVASFTLGKTSVHMLVMRGISWPSLVLRRILGLCSFSLMLRGERMAQRKAHSPGQGCGEEKVPPQHQCPRDPALGEEGGGDWA